MNPASCIEWRIVPTIALPPLSPTGIKLCPSLVAGVSVNTRDSHNASLKILAKSKPDLTFLPYKLFDSTTGPYQLLHKNPVRCIMFPERKPIPIFRIVDFRDVGVVLWGV
jgi:hypothetical protein